MTCIAYCVVRETSCKSVSVQPFRPSLFHRMVQFLFDILCQPLSDECLIGDRLHGRQLFDRHNVKRVDLDGNVLKFPFPFYMARFTLSEKIRLSLSRKTIFSGKIRRITTDSPSHTQADFYYCLKLRIKTVS